jgi:signal transduction histidine kinase
VARCRVSTMTSAEDTSFARLVSLACHDLRTPLATVHGFAKTLTRMDRGVDERTARFLGMIEAASGQLADLLDDLALVARIEGGRYDPALREADTLELARAGAALVEEGSVAVDGAGATVETEPEAVSRALSQLARCVVRHGSVPNVQLQVTGARVVLAPVPENVGPIVLGEELRDLGAAVSRRVVEALGGSVTLADGQLAIELPERPA